MQHRDIQYAFCVGLFAFMHVDMWVGGITGCETGDKPHGNGGSLSVTLILHIIETCLSVCVHYAATVNASDVVNTMT